MKQKKVDKTTRMENRKKTQIINYSVKIAIIAIIIIFIASLNICKKDTTYVCYNENSDVDYKVYLNKNQFYDTKYLEKNKQYIASLIKRIDAEFNYDLSIYEENVDFDYSYRVEAEVNVEEKRTGNSIYNFKEDLLKKQTFSGSSNTDIKIDEKVEIDYSRYNKLITKFVNVYDLENVESILKVSMYINVEGKNDKIKRDAADEYVVSLNIPLTTNTIAIDIDTNLLGCEEELLNCNCNKTSKKCPILIGLLLISIAIEAVYVIKLLRYVRTEESIYKLELKRILNSYGAYIQKISNSFDLTGYQLVFLDTFEDMLKIRDTIQEPILMVENDQKDESYFVIPSNTKILYIFGLKMGEIKK